MQYYLLFFWKVQIVQFSILKKLRNSAHVGVFIYYIETFILIINSKETCTKGMLQVNNNFYQKKCI